MSARERTFHRDFRITPTLEGLALRYPWGPDVVVNNEVQRHLDLPPGESGSPFSFGADGLSLTTSVTPDALRRRRSCVPCFLPALKDGVSTRQFR